MQESYTATLASIAEAIESIRDTAARPIGSAGPEAPAERASRLAETGIRLTTQISAITDQVNLLALTAAMRTGEQRVATGGESAELAAALEKLVSASRV